MTTITGGASLLNKVVIVTGVSRGIGNHVAKLFHSQGAKVIGVSRTSMLTSISQHDEEATQVVVEGQHPSHAQHHHHSYLSDHYAINVGDYDAVNHMFREIKNKHSAAHVLVNCAGVSRDALFARLNHHDIRDMIGVNLEGTIYMSRAFTKLAMTLKNQVDDFSITNVGSPVGSLMFPTGTSVYATTKAALNGLTKSLSAELLPYGIRVNMVRPGFVRTDMTKSIDFEARGLKETNIDDVANAILYLSTNKGMNGCIMDVNSGLA